MQHQAVVSHQVISPRPSRAASTFDVLGVPAATNSRFAHLSFVSGVLLIAQRR
jgi:hypothetical protein